MKLIEEVVKQYQQKVITAEEAMSKIIELINEGKNAAAEYGIHTGSY